MPVLTNKSRLRPGPPPNVPPWRWIDGRTLGHWLNVSQQSIVNWRRRDTGPEWRTDRSGRCWYRVADVMEWLGGGDATERIRMFLREYANQIRKGILDLPANEMVEAARLLDGELMDGEVERLVELIDRAEVFGKPNRKPKRFVPKSLFIGYASPSE